MIPSIEYSYQISQRVGVHGIAYERENERLKLDSKGGFLDKRAMHSTQIE